MKIEDVLLPLGGGVAGLLIGALVLRPNPMDEPVLQGPAEQLEVHRKNLEASGIPSKIATVPGANSILLVKKTDVSGAIRIIQFGPG